MKLFPVNELCIEIGCLEGMHLSPRVIQSFPIHYSLISERRLTAEVTKLWFASRALF
jgi:hypothetical protein